MNNPLPTGRRLPAAAGIGWLRQGGDLLGRALVPLLALGFTLQLITLFLQLSPLAPLLVLVAPLLSAGVILAIDDVQHSRRFSPLRLFSAFGMSPARGRLLALGGLNLLLLLAGTIWLRDDLTALQSLDLPGRVQAGEVITLDPEQLDVLRGVLFKTGLLLGAMGTLNYLTVPLLVLGRQPLLSAIGAGLRAMTLNWLPMLAFLAALVGLVFAALLILGLVTGLLTALLPAGPVQGFAVALLLLPAVIGLQMVLYAARYRTFVELFESRAPAPDSQQGGDAGDDGPDQQILA